MRGLELYMRYFLSIHLRWLLGIAWVYDVSTMDISYLGISPFSSQTVVGSAIESFMRPDRDWVVSIFMSWLEGMV